MESKDVKIFGPVIIESLGDGDKKTGRIFHEEIIKFKTFQEPNLSAFYYDEQTKESFLKRFETIALKVREEHYFPIIHLEAHGSKDGIHLGSGENLKWKELMPYLIEINVLIENRLMVSLGTCYGISLISAIDPTKRAPFRFVIGSTKEVTEKDVLIGFEKYFEIFYFSFDAVKSLDEMNKAIGATRFFIIDEEECFDKIVDPDRDPVFFRDSIFKLASERFHFNTDYKNIPFGKIFKQMESEAREALRKAKGGRGYFCMRDLRKKK